MKLAAQFALTIIAATLIGCNSTQTTESVPATPITPEGPALEPELQPLAIGDDAPKISIDHWVKGDAIEGFKDGQVYVLEFWATWCGPCVSSMPHLSSLQDKYEDTVKIIGVSSEKELETVTNFLDETNKKDNLLNTERMRYTITVDPDRSTYRVFMEASGQRGIPTAFIINRDGKVAWIGHPMNMDEPLEQVVNGSWDLAAATAEFEKEHAQDRAMLEMRAIYVEAMQNEDWDGWIAAIENFTTEYGDNPQMNSMKFNTLLNGKKDKEAAYAWARIMLEPSWDDPNALNAFAWNLVDETPEDLQDLDFALEVATRASELTNNEDAAILDTLARAYWELGDNETAIAWQQKAVDFAEPGMMADDLQATLARYIGIEIAAVEEAVADHPSTDHPSTDHPSGDHPSGDHPSQPTPAEVAEVEPEPAPAPEEVAEVAEVEPEPAPEEVAEVAEVEPEPAPAPEEVAEVAEVEEEPKEPELQPLAIGDDAPKISIDHWVKGDAIEGFKDGQVYVLEFWATWCGPCVSSMPHLSSLQDKYEDTVKIIGVSSEKELETVTNFLDETNKKDNLLNTERMRYTVTVDPDRSTSRVFMEASGQRGIPTAFIINRDGKVAWIGHPMNMDEPLEQVVNGSWDLAAAAVEFAKAQKQKNAMNELHSVYMVAMENEDWDGWIAAIENFTTEYGDNPQINSMKFDAFLNGKKDKEAAYAWARIMLESSWDNSQALNAFAWDIVDGTPPELQDLDFALEIATRASELTNNEDPMILDTLARAYWELGEKYKAIAWQQKAVEFAEESELGDSIAATLKEYESSLASVE